MIATKSKWIGALGAVLSLSIGLAQAEEGAFCDLGEEGCQEKGVAETIRTSQTKQPGPGQASNKKERSDSPGVLLPAVALVKGSGHAAVTIIEYSDFRCDPCSQAAQVLHEVIKAYPEDVQVIFKHHPSPLNSDAMFAHEAAMAAGEQGKFWEMHDRLFSHKGALTQEVLRQYAEELRLNTKKFLKALTDHRFRPIVVREVGEAKGFGVTGAPTFFINGRKLVGARAVGDFKRIIDEELGLTETAKAPSQERPTPSVGEVINAAEINLEGAQAKGKQDAPITIVEYSDFQCPFCARAVPTVQQVLNRYPAQVKVVFKNYPLDFHQDAPLAHEAALAAREQGKFWEMHDRIFLRQRAIKRDHLIQYAKELGLDAEKFQQDLDSGRYKEQIERDRLEGQRLGVTGTPTFFINGQRLTGARSLTEFSKIIEQQLRSTHTELNVSDVPSPVPAALSESILPRRSAAPVQIEAFLDLGSPLSAPAMDILRKMRAEQASEVNITIRPLPQSARLDAPSYYRAALAAGEQGKFREMQDLIFRSRGRIDRERLIGFARELKLDETKFKAALEKEISQFEQDRADEVKGMPVLFVNGQKLDGVPDLAMLSERVEKERRRVME